MTLEGDEASIESIDLLVWLISTFGVADLALQVTALLLDEILRCKSMVGLS